MASSFWGYNWKLSRTDLKFPGVRFSFVHAEAEYYQLEAHISNQGEIKKNHFAIRVQVIKNHFRVISADRS